MVTVARATNLGKATGTCGESRVEPRAQAGEGRGQRELPEKGGSRAPPGTQSPRTHQQVARSARKEARDRTTGGPRNREGLGEGRREGSRRSQASAGESPVDRSIAAGGAEPQSKLSKLWGTGGRKGPSK